jgi:hypothetical protein
MRRGLQENVVITLLLVGGFLWGIGWLVGVVLLWLSDAWTARQKLIGTLVVPGGLALPLFFLIFVGMGTGRSTSCLGQVGGGETCTSSGGLAPWERGLIIAGLVALAIAAIASAVFLARRARPKPRLLASA